MQTSERLTPSIDFDRPVHWLTDRAQRPKLCAELAAINGATIVRARSDEAAAAIADQLCRRGVPALHYGVGRGRRTARRDHQRFVSGSVPVLVSSGGLAELRFLRDRSVRCVINYDPATSRMLLRRSGVVEVTFVVPERLPGLDDEIEPVQPDLDAVRSFRAETPSPNTRVRSRRAFGARLAQVPPLVGRAVHRLRPPRHGDDPVTGSTS